MLIYKLFKKYVYEKYFINFLFIDYVFRELRNYILLNILDRIFFEKKLFKFMLKLFRLYYLILRDFIVKMS